MKIQDIRTTTVPVNRRGDWIFVHVETDEGVIGLGEASHSMNDRLLLQTIETMASSLTGSDPLEINRFRITFRGNRGGRVRNTSLHY